LNEIDVLKHAKTYMDKLANGINPLDDKPVNENDIINNVRLSRCFFYVSDILRQVIENGGSVKRSYSSSKNKADFNISFETIQKFEFFDFPVPVSKITDGINALVNTESMKKITPQNINEWLVSIDMLCLIENEENKTKLPTEAGKALGISSEHRVTYNREYDALFYDRKAQEFIIDNIEAILHHIKVKKQ